MPLANANAANAPGWSFPFLLSFPFYSTSTSFLPFLLPFYWFHHWRIIVGIIRRTFNLELIRPQLPFPLPLRLAFKPNEILQKAAKKKTWRGKWRKIPNKLRATKSKNFFLTRKRKTSLSRSSFFSFFFFGFSFHSSVTFCILFRQNLKLILKLPWSFVIFLCKKFSQGVQEGGGKEKAATHWCAFSWLWHWHTHTHTHRGSLLWLLFMRT